MAEQIVIPCELTITPGSSSSYARIRLMASGETVCDDYEGSLPAELVKAAKIIAAAHSRMLSKWSGK